MDEVNQRSADGSAADSMLTVVDVGDGVCTVVRPALNRGPAMIIDCGSTDLTAEVAGRRLRATLADRIEDVRTIVVTHFDADHYMGLVRMAESMLAMGERFQSMELVYPTIPSLTPRYALMFETLSMTRTGFRSLDLVEALQQVTDGPLAFRAVSRGDIFQGAGHTWRVHWPPRVLGSGVTRQVQKAIAQFEDLATTLHERGDDTLSKNLERARHGLWTRLPVDLADDLPAHRWPARETDDPSFADEEDWSAAPDEDDWRIDVPDDLRSDFRSAWQSFRRANNNMSVVCDEIVHRHLVAFGDAESPVMNAIVGDDALAGLYTVMLAPHHGTHALPRSIGVQAVYCISQNGSRLGRHWPKHQTTHRNGRPCHSTAAGNVAVGTNAPWCRS
ncbi:MBL fold metallo-hydrolase [Asanoa siamensis]|uniref:Metallo-beta-lactamase domain-containing protein n=1 Tax=Asanoa siamensis TaxID=926357 RepID=A0ABQ4D0W2_9ACTN|nr:MBL fold metallo-hydrolase [Asanoa siamensis]GIF77188.1 hypothetical protein Asi02nite_67060 [Asanoa siamensis]